MKKYFYLSVLLSISLIACSDDEVTPNDQSQSGNTPEELPEWYYTGGELGTTFNPSSTAFEDRTIF